MHALLGIQLGPGPLALPPEAQDVQYACGDSPGLGYQRIARETGGLRGSICGRLALDAFAQSLAALMVSEGGGQGCRAQLPAGFPIERTSWVKATLADRAVFLTGASDQASCDVGGTSYRLQQRDLVLCPRTCALLGSAGLQRLEVLGHCP